MVPARRGLSGLQSRLRNAALGGRVGGEGRCWPRKPLPAATGAGRRCESGPLGKEVALGCLFWLRASRRRRGLRAAQTRRSQTGPGSRLTPPPGVGREAPRGNALGRAAERGRAAKKWGAPRRGSALEGRAAEEGGAPGGGARPRKGVHPGGRVAEEGGAPRGARGRGRGRTGGGAWPRKGCTEDGGAEAARTQNSEGPRLPVPQVLRAGCGGRGRRPGMLR